MLCSVRILSKYIKNIVKRKLSGCLVLRYMLCYAMSEWHPRHSQFGDIAPYFLTQSAPDISHYVM